MIIGPGGRANGRLLAQSGTLAGEPNGLVDHFQDPPRGQHLGFDECNRILIEDIPWFFRKGGVCCGRGLAKPLFQHNLLLDIFLWKIHVDGFQPIDQRPRNVVDMRKPLGIPRGHDKEV